MQTREGAKSARQKFDAVVCEYSAGHALHIIQIDHTLVDLFIVDARDRRPLQRPWLTLTIDIASRMVAGFYLSLEPPSSTSVALAIQHLVMPKSLWLQARGIDAEWPVFGLPDIIHLDNGREFHGKALVREAPEHGIELVHRPVARPHYGGHIERLISTMMGAVHLLPGSTSSNIAKRGSYDPQKHAAMTLDELERWLALQIVGRYHADVHSALLLLPRTAWNDAVAARVHPLCLPHDPDQFLRDFLPIKSAASAGIACICSEFVIGMTFSVLWLAGRRAKQESSSIRAIFPVSTLSRRTTLSGLSDLRLWTGRPSPSGNIAWRVQRSESAGFALSMRI